MSIKKVVLFTALLAISQSSAFAQDDSKKPGSGPNPFTHCGIGAALFPDTNWAAVTSNVIWDAGTTAVTSATASPQTCSGKHIVAAMFINDTYDKLAEETARGEGEHLVTVLNILECSGAHQARAIEATRSALGKVIAQPGYATQDRTEKASQFYDAVDAAVTANCAV